MISPRLSAEHLSLAVFPKKNTVLKLELFSYHFWYGHISNSKISKFINSCVGEGFIIFDILILIKALKAKTDKKYTVFYNLCLNCNMISIFEKHT